MGSKSTIEEFRYWSFVCYAPEDALWSDWLHKSLETYGLPRILQENPTRFGPLQKRLFPVFRDRDELPLGAVEGDQIEAALRWSRTLIVICSPAAAGSAEVDRQVRYFKSLGRDKDVFCLLTDGAGGNAKSQIPQAELLPKAVRFQVDADQQVTTTPANPLIIDARRGRDSKFTARLKLVAAIIGCDFSVLKQRDVERAQRKVQLILSAMMILMMVFTALGVQLYMEKNKAVEARIEAERQREAAQTSEKRARVARDQAAAARKQAESARDKSAETLRTSETNRTQPK